ncbi:hypothetical protein F5J12DRAFT_928203 [Pisolithus orientalis]|uniref:uncharacterized protein n=1 Tax=Pisolithus orientalis TaxID=936130 RepID=UPI002224D2AC|nr:uncharacterized protein F5J12DRAFT_928203 [Pisolithus orientalis]KAI6002479.1 hypothetical protein F5J12DRAFT_928203 [Pisolithus orientalis]
MDSFTSFESFLLLDEQPSRSTETSSIPIDQEYSYVFQSGLHHSTAEFLCAGILLSAEAGYPSLVLRTTSITVSLAGISGSDYDIEVEASKKGIRTSWDTVSDATLQKVTRPDYKISSQSQEESSPDTQSEDDPESDTDIGTSGIGRGQKLYPHAVPFSLSDLRRMMKAWYEFDLAITVALVSPVGNWLTGGDHVKNVMLLLLLVFYLHQIIEGHGADHTLRAKDASAEDRYTRIASSELRAFELFYLALTILSPCLGFHILVHYPPSEMEKAQEHLKLLTEKVALLETQLRESQARVEAVSNEIYANVEETYEGMERGVRRQEKKLEAAKNAHETRLCRLEKDVESLLERKEIRADPVSPTLLSSLEEQLKILKPYWAAGNTRPTSPSRLRSCQKSGLCRSPPISLETIPERAAFQPTIHVAPSPFHILGLKLFFGIGDLITLPLRYLIAYLLSGEVYSFRGSPPFL